MPRTGLTDVARQAGVSVSTASRVLNKTQVTVPISDHTRKRVESAAFELGYRPSAAARALRTGQTRTFGVLGNSPQAFWLWSEGDGFTSEMMRGMMQAALEHSFHLTLLTGETAVDRMPDLGMVDGILVLNRDLGATPDIAEMLSGSGKPVLYLLDYPETQACHALAPDDVAMGRLATQTLLEAGHRRIGFARTANWRGIFGRREQGWRQAMEEAGMEAPASWSIEMDGTATIGAENLTALVCANSNIARAIREQEPTKVPTELSLIALVHADAQGNPLADLAAVTFPLSQIVHAGADRLIRLIKGEALEMQKQLYAPQYTVGPTLEERVS
ncbi:MAG: LacI family transcriptional regulator [Candidatus Latescibacterota bacterium]|jgi:LacI family transcriptional regulator